MREEIMKHNFASDSDRNEYFESVFNRDIRIKAKKEAENQFRYDTFSNRSFKD